MPTFQIKNVLNKYQKAIKLRLLSSMSRKFWRCPCFFLDVFISFCSSSKGLSNDIKTRVDPDKNRYLWYTTSLNNMHNIDSLGHCTLYKIASISIFTIYVLIQFCSPSKILSDHMKIISIDVDNKRKKSRFLPVVGCHICTIISGHYNWSGFGKNKRYRANSTRKQIGAP
jgi:hypothetical protein